MRNSKSERKKLHICILDGDFGVFLLESVFLEGAARYSHVFFGCWRGGIYIFRNVQEGIPVLEELWDVNGPKRCAIVEKVPTGSYQATLSRIGLSYIGF